MFASMLNYRQTLCFCVLSDFFIISLEFILLFKLLFFSRLHSRYFFKDFFQIFQFHPITGPIAITQIGFGIIIVVQRRRAELG